jgi:phosphosulfolactate synthase (CoM biosynthesis protein A)
MQEDMQHKENLFDFIKKNPWNGKPRVTGVTEIRGPYYSVVGKRYLEDILETMGEYIDSLKFAGGSFSIIQPKVLREIIETAHKYQVLISTGGFIEYVFTQGKDAVQKYIRQCKEAGFNIIEISNGFITLPAKLVFTQTTRCLQFNTALPMNFPL